MDAVNWAQAYAKINREIMMEDVMAAVREVMPGAEISSDEPVVDCHHNYVARETHYGRDVWVTRKGAVHAGRGELGIIPGSMGAPRIWSRDSAPRSPSCRPRTARAA